MESRLYFLFSSLYREINDNFIFPITRVVDITWFLGSRHSTVTIGRVWSPFICVFFFFLGGHAIVVRVFLLRLARQTIYRANRRRRREIRGAWHVFPIFHGFAGKERRKERKKKKYTRKNFISMNEISSLRVRWIDFRFESLESKKKKKKSSLSVPLTRSIVESIHLRRVLNDISYNAFRDVFLYRFPSRFSFAFTWDGWKSPRYWSILSARTTTISS